MAKKIIPMQVGGDPAVNQGFQMANENFTEVYDDSIVQWVEGTYTMGQRVFHYGGIWEVVVSSTSEEPKMGTSWTMKTLYPREKESLIEVSEFSFARRGKNIFNQNDVIVGKKLSVNGSLSDSSNLITSNFIRVHRDTNYVRNIDGTICFYDNSKLYISGVSSGLTFSLPPKTAYIRVTYTKKNAPEVQIEEGFVATAYEGYGYDFLNEKNRRIQ